MKARLIGFLTLVLSLTACGGGGGGSSASPAVVPVVPVATSAPTTSGTQKVTFTFTFAPAPATSSSTRRTPRFLSVGTTSLYVTLLKVNGASPSQAYAYSFPVTTSGTQPPCVSNNPNYGITCTFSATEPIGSDTFAIVAASTDGQPSGSTPYPVGINENVTGTVTTGSNSIPATLHPIITSNGTFSFQNDAYGAMLVTDFRDGTDVFSGVTDTLVNPITYTLSDSSGYAHLTGFPSGSAVNEGSSYTATGTQDTDAAVNVDSIPTGTSVNLSVSYSVPSYTVPSADLPSNVTLESTTALSGTLYLTCSGPSSPGGVGTCATQTSGNVTFPVN